MAIVAGRSPAEAYVAALEKVAEAASAVVPISPDGTGREDAAMRLAKALDALRKEKTGKPLDGSDVKALEHALTITESERDALRAKLERAKVDREELTQRLLHLAASGQWRPSNGGPGVFDAQAMLDALLSIPPALLERVKALEAVAEAARLVGGYDAALADTIRKLDGTK